MRHYCTTCKTLICIECIVDHSGHEFVKKEESAFILKETGEQIVMSFDRYKGLTERMLSECDKQKIKMSQLLGNEVKHVDQFFDGLISQLKVQRALVKKEYHEHWESEQERLN